MSALYIQIAQGETMNKISNKLKRREPAIDIMLFSGRTVHFTTYSSPYCHIYVYVHRMMMIVIVQSAAEDL